MGKVYRYATKEIGFTGGRHLNISIGSSAIKIFLTVVVVVIGSKRKADIDFCCSRDQ